MLYLYRKHAEFAVNSTGNTVAWACHIRIWPTLRVMLPCTPAGGRDRKSGGQRGERDAAQGADHEGAARRGGPALLVKGRRDNAIAGTASLSDSTAGTRICLVVLHHVWKWQLPVVYRAPKPRRKKARLEEAELLVALACVCVSETPCAPSPLPLCPCTTL